MQEKIKLNNGTEMPLLGLGTWKSVPGEVEKAVQDAITIGYRHIDCAMVYENEHEVGVALHNVITSGIVKREDLYIVSKLWNSHHRPDLVEAGLRESLKQLQLDYLDLYLIHSPMSFKENSGLNPVDENGKLIYSHVDYVETWRAMEACVQSGLTRSIGLSNFNSYQLQRICDICTIKPVTNQVECHPYLNQEKLLDYCAKRHIVLTAYSPLGSPDRPWAKPGDPSLLQDPAVLEIAKKHGKSPAQVLIRYQIERGVAVIPKSVSKVRIEENFSVGSFRLSEEDMVKLNSLDCNERYLHHEWVADHPYFPFAIEF
ncbi:aldo-keto reductase family 1 member B1-like [Daphnia pulicaria]|uniref:aldo-keto reductase family 1 member B1-like n=1 Tax=Daphnia pulicaria TaxID=35523 RepID=UPI001EEB4DBF|nr:aldo-keto reductase family 1 member B1-like [Daphnia pulicaria]